MGNTNKTVVTRRTSREGINFIFATDHEVMPDELDVLIGKYSERHLELTLPGDWLFVDLRTATPEFRAVPKDYDPAL